MRTEDMKPSNFYLITLIAIVVILVSACGSTSSIAQAPATKAPLPNALTSIKTNMPPHLDGSGDDLVWQIAPARVLDVTTSGIKPYQVTLKSAYDAGNIYILVQYPDNSKEVMRAPWVFNSEKKTWERLDDGVGDEDEFGFYWNVNVPDYQVEGCKGLCHDQDPNDKRMYTPKGTWVDIWTFNGARSAPMGWMRDMRQTDNPNASASGGFVEDEGSTTNPGYIDNLQTINGMDLPMYWKPYSGVGGIITGDQIFLLQSEIDAGFARKIVSEDANGNLVDEDGNTVPYYARVPGRILSAPSGPSWNDIKAEGAWLNGVWTVELSRKLNTGHSDDIQFDLNKDYYFDIYFKTRMPGEIDRQTLYVSKFSFAK